jgi:hypothetical protein
MPPSTQSAEQLLAGLSALLAAEVERRLPALAPQPGTPDLLTSTVASALVGYLRGGDWVGLIGALERLAGAVGRPLSDADRAAITDAVGVWHATAALSAPGPTVVASGAPVE